jgi:glutathione S-transferase
MYWGETNMNKLLHNDPQTAYALELYSKAKGLEITSEQVDADNKLHTQYTDNALIGMQSLPILLLSNQAYVTTTHSIVDYIEATRRGNKVFCSDPSPNPEQIATVHLIIRAIQNHLYTNVARPVSLDKLMQWKHLFDDFFSAVRFEGQQFLDENGFSIVDCFFYPATNMRIAMATDAKDKDALHTYRERVLSRTLHATDNTRNPDIWNEDEI